MIGTRQSGVWMWVLMTVCMVVLEPVRGQPASTEQAYAPVNALVQRLTPLRPGQPAHAELTAMLTLAQSVSKRPAVQMEPAMRWMSNLLDQQLTLGRDSERFNALLGTLMLAWSVSEHDPDFLVPRFRRLCAKVRQEQPQWPLEGQEVQWAAATLTLASVLPDQDEATVTKRYRLASFHRLRPALTRPASEAYHQGPTLWTLAGALRPASNEDVAHTWMELRHGAERLVDRPTHDLPFEEFVGHLLIAWSSSQSDEAAVVQAAGQAVAQVKQAGLTPWSPAFVRAAGLLTIALVHGASPADFDPAQSPLLPIAKALAARPR